MTNEVMLIRVDASPEIGYGHFMRTLALAQEWYRKYGNVLFVSKSLPATLVKHLKNKLTLIHLDSLPGTTADALETGMTALEWGSKCIIVDGYQFDSTYQHSSFLRYQYTLPALA